jgi:hypothetical protein
MLTHLPTHTHTHPQARTHTRTHKTNQEELGHTAIQYDCEFFIKLGSAELQQLVERACCEETGGVLALAEKNLGALREPTLQLPLPRNGGEK